MVAPSDVPRRRNGLSAPYSLPQIASWLFLAATAIQFVLFVSPILPVGASVALTIFFFLLVGAVCYYGMRAIAIDSMDVHLKKSLCEHRNGEIKKESRFLDRVYRLYNGDGNTIKKEAVPDNEETKQCWICDTQVAEHAMHCKYCNKCVSHFDHHCLWLNTCVGDRNYKDFFRVMISISTMQLVHMAISMGLVIDIFIHGPTEDRADDWLGASGASPAVAAVLLLFIVFDMCSLILLAQLIAFHVHLQKERITTYQYIVQDSQKRREKGKMLMELHQMRASELAKAEEQKKCWYAFRLKSGAKFREWGCGRLDPLELPQPSPKPDPNDPFASSLGGPVANGNDNAALHEQKPEQEDLEAAAGGAETDEEEPQDKPATSTVTDGGDTTNERHELGSQPNQSEQGSDGTNGDLEPSAAP